MNGSDPNGPLVVDVGGNISHDIEKFHQVYPETAHRLYLQDLTAVVKLAKCPDPVNKMAHDFFQPQPVLGRLSFSCESLKTILRVGSYRISYLLCARCSA